MSDFERTVKFEDGHTARVIVGTMHKNARGKADISGLIITYNSDNSYEFTNPFSADGKARAVNSANGKLVDHSVLSDAISILIGSAFDALPFQDRPASDRPNIRVGAIEFARRLHQDVGRGEMPMFQPYKVLAP